jgi:hypothetical protein
MIAAGPQALQELKLARAKKESPALVLQSAEDNPPAEIERRDSKKLARTGNFRKSLPGAIKAHVKKEERLPRKSGILNLLDKKQFGVIGGSKKRWVELRDGVIFVTRNAV